MHTRLRRRASVEEVFFAKGGPPPGFNNGRDIDESGAELL